MYMRILYHHRTRATDAQGIHIFQIVKALRDAGHTVELASVARADGPLQESSAGGSPKATGLQKVPYLSELVQLGYNAIGIPMLLWKMWRGRVDFVYERYSLFNFSGVLAAKLMGRPIVLEVNSPLALEQYRDGHIRWYGLALRIARGVQNKLLEALAMGKRVMASAAVCETFGGHLPEGLVRCKTTADYAGYVAASANGCIRRRATVQFRWERSLETISLELSNIRGECHPSILKWS